MVSPGDTVQVRILRLDSAAHRIALSMRIAEPEAAEEPATPPSSDRPRGRQRELLVLGRVSKCPARHDVAPSVSEDLTPIDKVSRHAQNDVVALCPDITCGPPAVAGARAPAPARNVDTGSGS